MLGRGRPETYAPRTLVVPKTVHYLSLKPLAVEFLSVMSQSPDANVTDLTFFTICSFPDLHKMDSVSED